MANDIPGNGTIMGRVDVPVPAVNTWIAPPEVRLNVKEALTRRATIVDVARECGVTAATVSRVLNHKRPSSASEETRARVFEVAKRLGYMPDLAARNLNRSSTKIIGLFASPYTNMAEGINEPLLEGMADFLHNGGYEIFIELGPVTRQRGALPFWRFDGAILLQAPKPETVRELDNRKVPYVCVNEQVGHPVAAVLADDTTGMRRLVEHLAMLGHRKIAYANALSFYHPHYSVAERHDTLVQVSQKHSIELTHGHDRPFTTPLEFLRQAVVDNGATAVIAYDHSIALSLTGAAHTLHLRVPTDFSLACFNDVFPVAVIGPPLTVVAVSGREMGRVGAGMLLHVLQGGTPQSRVVRIAEDLIVRASTTPPPAI